jgi:protein ImuA
MSCSAADRVQVPLPVPGTWRACDAPGGGAPVGPVCPTGHAVLDAHLAGGGWPLGGVVEVLQDVPGPQAWSLVAPALWGALTRLPQPGVEPRQRLVLVGVPAVPLALAWQARGLSPTQWVQVHTTDPARRLWACEQALACPEVGAVLAWLPQASFAALRRLQLAASRHGGLVWVCRPEAARTQPSPAVVRLLLSAGTQPGHLRVHILKHRGAAVAQPLDLPLADARVQAWLDAARWRQAQRRRAADLSVARSLAVPQAVPQVLPHAQAPVLDRPAMAPLA